MPSPSPAWWTMSVADTFQKLEVSSQGLTSDEAGRRLKREGPNELPAERRRAAWVIFLSQFKNPLMLILIAASVTSWALGERASTIIIFIVVIVGATLAFVQEYRSERIVEQLQQHLTRWANVLRDGNIKHLDAREIVVGDIVDIGPGNIVPADIRLLEIEDLEIDESMLTGESLPVPKTITPLVHEHALPQEQTNMAFAGTAIVQGSGRGVVVATGASTAIGMIGASLATPREETEFQKGVRSFGTFLLRLTLGLTVVVFVALWLTQGKWTETLLFSLALAVGISPELLPLIVTLNLSHGALLMSKKHVLVKRLTSIEDIGNADVMCTDKTGTLTVGVLRVRASIDPNGDLTILPLSYAGQCLTHAAPFSANPVDAAIHHMIEQQHVALAFPSATFIEEIAFDFKRRRMSQVLEDEGLRWLLTKGAVQEVLACCSKAMLKDGTSRPMSDRDRVSFLRLADRYHDTGARLIAIARRPLKHKEHYMPEDETDLELVGFIVTSDAPKSTAKQAIKAMCKQGVRIVILTGDNERVTRSIAEQIGFSVEGMTTGDAIDAMDDQALQDTVTHTNVFARITPDHKLRIIRALQAKGLTTAFMGDGINDAPALRQADVGISFHEASDVAREAADVILLKRGLDVVSEGIAEGRRTFARTMTYIRATISSNFGNMLTLAGAAVLLPFIPLLPVQILLLNILSDLPLLAIPTDRVASDDLKRPQHWNIKNISHFMYFFGLLSSVGDYATFAILLFSVRADLVLFRSGWFVESLLTEIIVVFLVRTRARFSLKNLPGRSLFFTSIVTVALSFILIVWAGPLFGLAPLPLSVLLVMLLIVVAYALLIEAGKFVYRRWLEGGTTNTEMVKIT